MFENGRQKFVFPPSNTWRPKATYLLVVLRRIAT